ncbi:MAG: acyl-CoA dehydrogenase family protein, partial [Pannonibacter phragmitetus]
MEGFRAQADRTARLLQATPGWQAVQAFLPDYDSETVEAVLREAAAFAVTELAPLNAVSDRQGCRIVDGRVKTPAGFAQAYRRYAEAGWLGMDLPEAHGGQGLPLTLQAACLPLFERGCVSMMMAAGSSRAACHLLAAVAEPALAAEWISRLL